MANSVVKVSDTMLNNSLLLLVGEDGTVTPDRGTVETYLQSKRGSTNIRLMHINKTDDKGIDISVDDLTYVPDVINEVEVTLPTLKQEVNMNELERNLYSFRLDHDYTSFEYSSTTESPPLLEELTQSLEEEKDDSVSEKVLQELPPPVLVKSVATTELAPSSPEEENQAVPSIILKDTQSDTSIKTKPKAKVINADWQKTCNIKSKTPERVKIKGKPKIVQQIEDEFIDDLENEDDDEDFDCEDDINDSDYETNEISKSKLLKKNQTHRKSSSRVKISNSQIKTQGKHLKTEHSKYKDNLKNTGKSQLEEVVPETVKNMKDVEKNRDDTEKDKSTPQVVTEKKIVKKEKKIPKPIPNDFLLFSTPDIIRRVGKDPLTPVTPDVSSSPKVITKSSPSEQPTHSSNRLNRLSLDSKTTDRQVNKLDKDDKSKERRASMDKIRKTSIDEKSKSSDSKKENSNKPTKPVILQNIELSEQLNLAPMPTPEDIRSIIMTEDVKSYTTSTLPLVQTSEISSTEPADQNMALDTSSLDIDQSLLDNINNDEISEDILYQVAQSLVGNTDLQNAIDKGLNDGNLILDPAIQETINPPSQSSATPMIAPLNSMQGEDHPDIIRRGTQIVRPDGRIVVIPPIERPTTRSRNRRQNVEPTVPKAPVKPLDNEHVSGNELDSPDDDDNDDEEESEDDPNKLWCICNQPHNNRFMICCDTCEEWYHGKCVNITKAMGQQMEEEGREWICLFCKDPSLKRPQAAARRIRKASRTSTDSAESSKRNERDSVTCIVCQKPARTNSIYCSQKCILAHASGIDRVVVIDKSTGKMLSGNKAPSSQGLDQWLKDHPTYEVYRSRERMQQKVRNPIQSKLKIIKNEENDGVSLEVRKKGIKVGVLRHLPKNENSSVKFEIKSPPSAKPTGIRSEPVQPQKFYAKTATAPGTKKPDSSPKLLKPVTPVTPNRPKLVQTTLKTTPTSSPKDKTIPLKTPKARQAEQQTTTPQSKQHENIRENVQKTLFEQLTNRLKLDGNVKLSEDDVKEISNEIESQLYKCFGDTGQKYRNKYRSLIFNIKDIKNQTLWKRICQKSINAYQLVRLSPDDLASQELALWREREAKHSLEMIKKSELELLNCSRQYVLKTHKGEQVLDEESRPSDKIDNTEVIRTLTEDPNGDGKESRNDSKDSQKRSLSKHSHKDRDRKTSKDRSSVKDHRKRRRSSSKDRDRSKDNDRNRRRSSSKDRSKRERKRSRSKDRHRKSSHKSSRHKKDISHGSTTDKLDKKSKEILEQLVDNKIVPPLEDRLWKHVSQEDVVPGPAESDSDHEPSSTVTIPTPPHVVETEDQGIQTGTKNVQIKSAETKAPEIEKSMSPPPLNNQLGEIWRGTISMIDVAHITITAHEVSGDCSDLGDQLPPNLDIVGRISPDTVWDYIGKMKCSNSKIISLVRLSAVNVVEKMPYLALYSYLSSRKRLGVVKSTNKAIKDFYVLPLAQQKPIPQALLPINGPGFEESRPALLLGIIVRDKRKRGATLDLTPSYPSLIPKKSRVVTPPLPSGTPPVVVDKPSLIDPPRSYTPPSSAVQPSLNKDPRIKILLPPALPTEEIDDGDEPYSPEDSDPDSSSLLESGFTDTSVPPPKPSTSTKSAASSFPYTTAIPGLDVGNILPASTVEIQKQMEELNKKIEAQKSEIHSISKNIVSASTEIGHTALANIALPSNLQQILDSIKTISTDGGVEETIPQKKSADSSLTIPLILPKSFSRPLNQPTSSKPADSPNVEFPTNTIPLNLPTKTKLKVSANNSPHGNDSPGVLSSLSEEELVKKAAEMLGQTDLVSPPREKKESAPISTVYQTVDNSSSSPAKKAKFENDESFDIEPPIPGIDN